MNIEAEVNMDELDVTAVESEFTRYSLLLLKAIQII